MKNYIIDSTFLQDLSEVLERHRAEIFIGQKNQLIASSKKDNSVLSFDGDPVSCINSDICLKQSGQQDNLPKKMIYKVTVQRTGISQVRIPIEATSIAEAERLAYIQAGNHTYTSSYADYKIKSINHI